MVSQAPPRLDHAVINVLHDMDAAVERFRAMGFFLTDRGYHSMGSINHLMMFGTDYLELIGLPGGDGPQRQEVVDSPAGLNGLVFAADDANGLHADLSARGLSVLAPLAFSRPVTLDGQEHQASFRTVRMAAGALQGGRVYFCEHRTPELVWQPQWQRHDNGVVAVAGFSIVVPDPQREAEIYADLLSTAARRLTSEESVIELGQFTLKLLTVDSYHKQFGRFAFDAGDRTAFMGALSLRTTSLRRARDCLAQFLPATELEFVANRSRVAASAAFGAVIDFVE